MMAGLYRLSLQSLQTTRQTQLGLGLLAILLAFIISLNALVDIDCFRIQTTGCCCSPSPAAQNAETQADSCTHCTDWLVVMATSGHPVNTPPVALAVQTFIGRVFYLPRLERPPIFA